MTGRERWLVAYRAATDLLGRIAFLALTVIAARRLSPDAFGLFTLGTTLGWLAAVASDAGTQMHVARVVSRSPRSADAQLRRWFSWRVMASFVALTAVVGLIRALGVPNGNRSALLLLTAVYLITGLVEFLYYVCRGLGRSDIESSLGLAQRAGTLACGAAALWWRPDLTVLSAALVVPPVLTLARGMSVVRRLTAPAGAESDGGTGAMAAGGLKGDLWSADQAGWRSVAREFGRDVAPIGIGILMSALYFRVDTLLIERWQGATAVGLYGAVFRIVDALRLFPAAALAVALPALCRAPDLRVARALAAPLTLASAAGAGLGWLVAPWLVPALYGQAFADAVPVLRILLLAFPLMTLNYVLTQQLIGWNGHRAFAALCGAALVVNVVFNARLIPAWSIAGAAWTTLITEVVLTIGCLWALAGRGRERDAEARLDRAWQEI